MNPEPVSTLPAPAVSPVVRIVGVGGAGGRLAHALSPMDPAVSAMAVDTDAWALRRLEGIPTVTVGDSVLRGLGCGGDALQAATVAEHDQARLKSLVSGTGLLVLMVGMGGGAGSGIVPVLARLARDSGWVVVVIATVPFEFEGPLRRANAHQGLTALRSAADLVIPISLQGLMRSAAESARAEELLRWANDFVLGVARELLRMLSGTPLIPLGIADLARVFRGRQTEGGAAAVEASGELRSREVWDLLCAHPLLRSPNALAEAGVIVLQVAGGPDLKIEELEWLEKRVQDAAPRAQVLLGAVTQPVLAGRLTALLVVAPNTGNTTSSSTSEAEAEAEVEPSPAGKAARKEALMFEDLVPASGGSAGRGGGGFSGRSGTGGGKTRSGFRNFQQQFDFAPRWRGRFEGVEGTLRGGENLDEPTFARRGVKLN
ncbi:MAG: hypothetical protein RIS76_40 [Verrucomicrobiota bacterium]